eukprot:4364447-Heterocapsa_arctica.AAC.1
MAFVLPDARQNKGKGKAIGEDRDRIVCFAMDELSRENRTLGELWDKLWETPRSGTTKLGKGMAPHPAGAALPAWHLVI